MKSVSGARRCGRRREPPIDRQEVIGGRSKRFAPAARARSRPPRRFFSRLLRRWSEKLAAEQNRRFAFRKNAAMTDAAARSRSARRQIVSSCRTSEESGRGATGGGSDHSRLLGGVVVVCGKVTVRDGGQSGKCSSAGSRGNPEAHITRISSAEFSQTCMIDESQNIFP